MKGAEVVNRYNRRVASLNLAWGAKILSVGITWQRAVFPLAKNEVRASEFLRRGSIRTWRRPHVCNQLTFVIQPSIRFEAEGLVRRPRPAVLVGVADPDRVSN